MRRKNSISKSRRFVKMAQTINRLELIEAMAAQPAPETPLADRIGAMLRQNRGSILLTKINPVDTETIAIERIETL